MSWNDQGNNNGSRDPWGRNNNPPPDIDELIKKFRAQIKKNVKNNKPTIPSTLKDELECNIFLRTDNLEIQKLLGINSGDPIKTFTKLRDLKDNF